jgi:hypothetical protein
VPESNPPSVRLFHSIDSLGLDWSRLRTELFRDRSPNQPILKAITTQDPVEAESLKEAAYLSEQLTYELLLSDLLVIACPMWNFGIPSSMKAWIHHVDALARPSTSPWSQ